jgi:hypothetical protein
LQNITRFTFTILIAIITSLGAFALVGCTDDNQQNQSTSAQSQTAETESSDAASDSGDDDQDNCYGDDLPAVKK